MPKPRIILVHALCLITFSIFAAERSDLRVGVAGHAFDHLGNIGEQATAAVMSGATIIYGTGFGALGYAGLPAENGMEKVHHATSNYLSAAKKNGLRLGIGYVCATSIVQLENFDRNWPETFRNKFSTKPAEWLQQDINGKPLPSWYGGDYRPACMNNPDWRSYEKFIVLQQLQAGYDGIFFDNPTVHPQGCYCQFCMAEFALFLKKAKIKIAVPSQNSMEFLRKVAVTRPKEFLRFRSTIAADFLAEIRSYARSQKPNALITCNNSLNSPDVFFSQCRNYGYNIFEMSKAEDLVVVEDMSQQPRILANGNIVEYGPVYEMLRAISHGKPLVAVTLADGDYHTPPNLVRLAMAEAAAHQSSYLSWPAWPENQRARMISGVGPQAIFLRENASFLNDTVQRADVFLFLPFQNWVETAECKPLAIARSLGQSNIQFAVVTEEALVKTLKSNPHSVLVAESPQAFSSSEKMVVEQFKKRGGTIVFTLEENWFSDLKKVAKKSASILRGPMTMRLVVHDQPKKTIVHILNFNVQRLSSFEDKVSPANDVHLQIRVPFSRVHGVKAISADSVATQGLVPFTSKRDKGATVLEVAVPHVFLSTILVIE